MYHRKIILEFSGGGGVKQSLKSAYNLKVISLTASSIWLYALLSMLRVTFKHQSQHGQGHSYSEVLYL